MNLKIMKESKEETKVPSEKTSKEVVSKSLFFALICDELALCLHSIGSDERAISMLP